MWYLYSPTIPPGDVDVGNVAHTTWEGSGLHLSSSPHTELGTDGINPDC